MVCLRPQLPCHAGRLTVLLDLDGTLVSSFTPRRAPALPPSMKTHLVGVGSSLNPAGVFVVERPGLGQFLQQLAAISEVVVFTAGELPTVLPAGLFASVHPGPMLVRVVHHAMQHTHTVRPVWPVVCSITGPWVGQC